MKSRDKIIKISRNNINKLHNLINKSNNTEHNSINNLLIFEKKDTVNFPNIYSNLNILTPSQKRNIDGEKLININMRKINKLYISNNSKSKNSKIKDLNDFNKINPISKRDFSNRKPANKILEALSRSSNTNLELSKLNSSKDENSIFNNLTKKNVNYLKNINKSNLIEMEKIKMKYDNSNIDNKSNFNAFSENNSNKNTNVTTQRKTLKKAYLKTDVDKNKDNNIKFLLLNKNCFYDKSNKDNNIGDDLCKLSEKNIFKDKINKKEENNIKTIKIIHRNNDGHSIKENLDYLNKLEEQKIKKKIMINSYDSFYFKDREDFDCPEELHFYYIKTIQRGRKNENKF